MPYKDPKNPKNIAYRKWYYEEHKDMWSYDNPNRKVACDKWRNNNKVKCAASSMKRRQENHQEFIERGRIYYNDNKPTLNTKSRNKTELLTDGYMRKHLLKIGYTRQDIKQYPDLLEAHRLIIKIKRYEKHQRVA